MFYLAMTIGGAFLYMVARPAIHTPGDAAQTAANLIEHETTARFAIAAALLASIGQSGTVLYLYKLFGRRDQFSATALVAFGVINTAAGMMVATFWTTGLSIATGTGYGGSNETVLLLFDLSQSIVDVGYLFWGLWLLPMGWLVTKSEQMPRLLGRMLMVGAAGYTFSAFIGQMFDGRWVDVVVEAVQVPAHIGEVWMVGYLLVFGAGIANATVNDKFDNRGSSNGAS